MYGLKGHLGGKANTERPGGITGRTHAYIDDRNAHVTGSVVDSGKWPGSQVRHLNLIACHRNTSVSSDVGKQHILDPLGVSGENDLKGQKLEVREAC